MINKINKFSTLENIIKETPEYFFKKYYKDDLKDYNFKNCGGLRTKGKFKKTSINKPLITIITVCYNSETFLEKTIKSVLAQKYNNIEYIIIDGDSNDATVSIIKKYEEYIDFWVSEKDDGIYDAINKGILLSSGSIIGILNSNDIYTEDALILVKNYFTKNEIDVLFGTVKKDRILSGFNKNKIFWKFNIYPAHSSGFFITQNAQMLSGLYDLKFKLHSDYDLIFRIIDKLKLKGVATKRDELIGIFNTEGISSKESSIDYFIEEFKIRKKNNQNIFFLIFLFANKVIYHHLCKIYFIKKIFYSLRKKINF